MATGPRELALELLLEASPVQQPRQLIVVGEELQPLFIALAVGDVAPDDRGEHHATGPIPDRRDRQRHGDPAAVVADPLGFQMMEGLAIEHPAGEVLLLAP